MQWDAEGSFTRGEPWLPFAADHERVNVAAQREDPDSLLSLYRALLALRRTEPDLVTGAYRTLEAGDDVLRFARGDSLEVRIDFAAGDGEILRHGTKVRARTR
jgi:alpha-glucosidase